ncbi:hypothetical protein [Leifsonia poae]|nr:hypothetical protein [Leifsonia poae]
MGSLFWWNVIAVVVLLVIVAVIAVATMWVRAQLRKGRDAGQGGSDRLRS